MFKKTIALFIVPLLILLWSQFGAQNLTTYSFHALTDYPSPYLGALPPGAEGQPLSNQVVIIVVDALRADTSRAMPAVNALRAKGADRDLQVGQPSFSLPGWTVIGTGTWQEQSGVTLNFYSQDINVETIFEAAKRKGLTTGLAGAWKEWKQLFTRGVDSIEAIEGPKDPTNNLPAVRQQDDEIEAAAAKMLSKHPNLMLIHFGEADEAGHARGAASAEYRSAAMAIDARIARITSAIDLDRSTIFVTGDHGMLDKGGHGGWEPEVLTVSLAAAGKGIKPGKYAATQQADIAPTVALLLGTNIPSHNQGLPMFDMLDATTSFKAQRAVDTAEEISLAYAQIGQVLKAPAFDHSKLDQAKQALASSNSGTAFQSALEDIQSTRTLAASARETRFTAERLARLPMALLILTPFVMYVFLILRSQWDWKIPVIGALTYFVVYNALFFGRGFTFSLSIFNSEEQIVDFFTNRTIDAMIALIVGAILVGVVSRHLRALTVVRHTLDMAFFVMFASTIQVLLFIILYGIDFPWYLPDPAWGFKYYLDVLQTGAFWPLPYLPLLLLLPFVALTSRWIYSRQPFHGSQKRALDQAA